MNLNLALFALNTSVMYNIFFAVQKLDEQLSIFGFSRYVVSTGYDRLSKDFMCFAFIITAPQALRMHLSSEARKDPKPGTIRTEPQLTGSK